MYWTAFLRETPLVTSLHSENWSLTIFICSFLTVQGSSFLSYGFYFFPLKALFWVNLTKGFGNPTSLCQLDYHYLIGIANCTLIALLSVIPLEQIFVIYRHLLKSYSFCIIMAKPRRVSSKVPNDFWDFRSLSVRPVNQSKHLVVQGGTALQNSLRDWCRKSELHITLRILAADLTGLQVV